MPRSEALALARFNANPFRVVGFHTCPVWSCPISNMHFFTLSIPTRLVVAACLECLAAGAAEPPGADLFALTNVPAFVIEIDAAGMQSLRRAPRNDVKATVRLGQEVFRDVGIHIKGSQGSLQNIDQRPALTLSFNRFVPKQKCHGLRKLHLNNSAEDPTKMTDVLCSELFRQAGVPAARGAYATLQLNRRHLGLYVLKEGLTKEFLAQHFRKTDGNLYDGGFRRDVNQPLERIHGDGPDDQSDRLALVAALREPDAERRWSRLRQVLDMDRFITSLALQTITWNWDGYAMERNNYRIYHDPESGKLVFIPHGLDQMFWKPDGTIYPRMNGLAAAAVMRNPEGRKLYRARLASLHADLFKVSALAKRLNELAALIEPHFPAVGEAANNLRRLILARSRSIADQLQRPEPAPSNPGGNGAR